MKCTKCQTEYEGNFCPNCGTPSNNNQNIVNTQNNYNTSNTGYAPYNSGYDVNTKQEKAKKPLHKKWWFWLIIVLVVFVAIGSFGSAEYENDTQTTVNTTAQQTESSAVNEPSTEVEKETKPSVPVEYKNALLKAKVYAKEMHMSKQAVYEQLVSEYGEKFPEDAAQYAIDNLDDVDWNLSALEKAKVYQETMHMSKDAIYDQLTSEYGEKFTKEQAKYAVDHLQ